jgi:hypothetical protein
MTAAAKAVAGDIIAVGCLMIGCRLLKTELVMSFCATDNTGV